MFSPIKTAPKEELLSRYYNGIKWIDSHKCQPDTNNMFDINGEVYEKEKFEACCKTLEQIEDALNKRFPNWKENDSVEEVVSDEKVAGYENNFFELNQLNESEQLKVMKKHFGDDSKFVDEKKLKKEEEIINKL